MALITISGESGCRSEEVARIAAQRLRFELITENRLTKMIGEEFGSGAVIPDKAYVSVVSSVLARLAAEHHLVGSAIGAEAFLKQVPGMLRVRSTAPDPRRAGMLMGAKKLVPR